MIEFRVVSDAPAASLIERTYAGEILYLEPQPLISDPDLLAVRPDVRDDRLIFSFELTPEGERRLRQNTEHLIGGRIVLLLESRVVNVFVVRSPLGPRGVVEGKLPRAEANRLALRIRALWPERKSQSWNRIGAGDAIAEIAVEFQSKPEQVMSRSWVLELERSAKSVWRVKRVLQTFTS